MGAERTARGSPFRPPSVLVPLLFRRYSVRRATTALRVRAAQPAGSSAPRTAISSPPRASRTGWRPWSDGCAHPDGADRLRVDVKDSGGTPDASASTAGNSRGPLGLRERLTVYGGSLTTGRRPTCGYRVTALIPLKA
ncbi:hypothetical protein ACIOHS_21540 [Streptomyces sp. NPDC088253]|uniref:hypothetical protein n=1 Tax=Streptomyces sp. NPDC088253 TaxID=3365846 RepID=UPI00380A75DF